MMHDDFLSTQAQGTDHENLARAIFDELNDAYSRFEESGAQPLYWLVMHSLFKFVFILQ